MIWSVHCTNYHSVNYAHPYLLIPFPIFSLSFHHTLSLDASTVLDIQVVLVLRQGCVPEKSHTNWNRANQTQNSHLKDISWWLGDWQPHPIYCITIPLVDIQICRVCMHCICSIYAFLYRIHTFLYNMFTYFWCNKNARDSHP